MFTYLFNTTDGSEIYHDFCQAELSSFPAPPTPSGNFLASVNSRDGRLTQRLSPRSRRPDNQTTRSSAQAVL